VKYSQHINFSQLTPAEKTEIKNLCRAPPYLFFSNHQAAYKLISENLTPLYTLNVSGWVAVLKETL